MFKKTKTFSLFGERLFFVFKPFGSMFVFAIRRKASRCNHLKFKTVGTSTSASVAMVKHDR